VRPLFFPVLTLLLFGCTDPEETTQPVSLIQVAQKITFKSVARLGPHHMLATITRTEMWDDGESSEHDETVELTWNNWDAFHLRRSVDGKTVFESIVNEGHAFSRTQGAKWTSGLDPESARLGLRTKWNVWQSAFDTFDERIGFRAVGGSTVATRAARHFSVEIIPLAEGQRVRGSRPQPEAVQGSIWLDEATGVRLSVDVTGVVRIGGARHQIHLSLSRSGFGTEQTIVSPAIRIQKNSDLLGMKAPPRPEGYPQNYP
jgi:hypothetical protein